MNIEHDMLAYAAHDDYHVTAGLLNKGAREIADLRQRYLAELAENNRLRAELERAVRDINRIGLHAAAYEGCPICALVRSYGFDPEALRES